MQMDTAASPRVKRQTQIMYIHVHVHTEEKYTAVQTRVIMRTGLKSMTYCSGHCSTNGAMHQYLPDTVHPLQEHRPILLHSATPCVTRLERVPKPQPLFLNQNLTRIEETVSVIFVQWNWKSMKYMGYVCGVPAREMGLIRIY